jgi:Ribbon-helix-helix protein, copG family.
MVRYRTVSIREDVYQRLNRLATERGKSMSDLIEDLLKNHEGGVDSGVVERLGRIEAILRDCLDRLGVRQLAENKPVGAESMQTEAVPVEPSNEAGDSLFGDNPWVQILRVRYGSQDS